MMLVKACWLNLRFWLARGDNGWHVLQFVLLAAAVGGIVAAS